MTIAKDMAQALDEARSSASSGLWKKPFEEVLVFELTAPALDALSACGGGPRHDSYVRVWPSHFKGVQIFHRVDPRPTGDWHNDGAGWDLTLRTSKHDAAGPPLQPDMPISAMAGICHDDDAPRGSA